MMQRRGVSRRRAVLRVDLTILSLIGVLLIAALGAGGMSLYRDVYSPSAFVQRYLDLLADGRAADALQMPGVSVDLARQHDTGIDVTASEALLRATALSPLTDYAVISEKHVISEKQKSGVYSVATEYRAGGVHGATTYTVVQDGWMGVVPNWRFERSPLAEIELTVRGSDTFTINGFPLHRNQVSAQGAAAKPLDPLHLLVFTPALYSISVDTAIAATPGLRVLTDAALTRTAVDVQAQPTEEFISLVQEKVEEFLNNCTAQQVLLPTACPFGLEVQHRLAEDSLPTWSITQQPRITVDPDGASWRIPTTDAVAHIDVRIKSVFDGSVRAVSEDVPFQIDGTISILPDGTASIRVGSPTTGSP